MQSEKGQDGHNDHDEANEVYDSIHSVLQRSSSPQDGRPIPDYSVVFSLKRSSEASAFAFMA